MHVFSPVYRNYPAALQSSEQVQQIYPGLIDARCFGVGAVKG